MDANTTPPALAALANFPHLSEQVARSLAMQAQRIAERTAHFIARPALLRALDERIRAGAGLITLEGVPGSGTTTLLCHLAATRPYAFWLADDDAGAGVEALCAQLLALHQLPIRLVPPAAGRDALTLERLLTEAGAARPPDDPLVVLIDRPPDEHSVPIIPPFPAIIPPGVVIILACSPKASQTLPVAARLPLPSAGARLQQRLAQLAIQLGCLPESLVSVAKHSQGSFLYVRLATGLLQTGTLQPDTLPSGLDGLHRHWWGQLDQAERRLASVIAAAGEPLDMALWATLAAVTEVEVRGWVRRWQAFLESTEDRVRLYHTVTRAFIATQSGDQLAGAHAAYVALAHARSGGQLERLKDDTDGYLVGQIARHIALSDAATLALNVPMLLSRPWIVARERTSGTMRAPAQDIAWALRQPAHADAALELIRGATIGGTLTLLSRTLHPDAAADAFDTATGGGAARDPTLKRLREMLDQLPDGRNKGQALRRLGEVCYALRMRASAMRMLSEALDLEASGPPRAWRDEREDTLAAFARAAIAIDLPRTALGITARIGHAERRGMIETEAVRWMLAHGQRTRAEEVAYAIGHQAMHEWAMAEVAVGHMRTNDMARGEVVLSTLKTETAIAWARGELACDAAFKGDTQAALRVTTLTNPSLRDRALALVALAFVAGGKPDAALETARMAEDREVRARALIDLALLKPPNAVAALTYASADIIALTTDDRASLVAALAAAQASVERLETGLHTIELLPEEEERDRAQSRVAVALGMHGNHADALIVAEVISDDDERDWAFDELARQAAGAGDWEHALTLAARIDAIEQRARTEADLAIAWARAGGALEAYVRIELIAVATERARAHALIVGALVAAGGHQRALATLAQLHEPNARSRYQTALAAGLAANDELIAAQGVARSIARPFDRARALIAIARAAVANEPSLAYQALGDALRITATLGRAETFTCLEWAADTLAKLGGGDLLLAAASALDEIDSWWG